MQNAEVWGPFGRATCTRTSPHCPFLFVYKVSVRHFGGNIRKWTSWGSFHVIKESLFFVKLIDNACQHGYEQDWRKKPVIDHGYVVFSSCMSINFSYRLKSFISLIWDNEFQILLPYCRIQNGIPQDWRMLTWLILNQFSTLYRLKWNWMYDNHKLKGNFSLLNATSPRTKVGFSASSELRYIIQFYENTRK